MVAGRAVLCRQDESDTSRFEPVQIKELRTCSRSVEQRGLRAARQQRLAKRRERGEADAACNHPRFGGRLDHFEWSSERPETGDRVALDRVVQNFRRHADALAQQRQPLDAMVRLKYFEY